MTTLSELAAPARRLALVGLAKNTGKTVALTALLGELQEQGRAIGVTSVGRDGEERDAIDARIEKPRIELAAGALVATTGALLQMSGLDAEVLVRTGLRTPLGPVSIARLREGGAVEVAGPGAAADVREVADAMLDLGAEQVLIDGAIDRRAASSPTVSDGLVMSTGAVLSRDLEEVVARTADAVALARLPAAAHAAADAPAPQPLPDRFALTADAEAIAALLDRNPDARAFAAAGALPEHFLAELASALRRRQRELELQVADSTHVFLHERGPGFYARQGLSIAVREPISLLALTVNPVAPRSHELDSRALRDRLAQAIGEVPVVDVLDPDYAAAGGAPPISGRATRGA